MGHPPLDLSRKHQHFGRCAWDGCSHAGALTKGLCRRHYDALRTEAMGLGHWEPHHHEAYGPSNCVCAEPRPIAVRIIGGHVIVPGAFQCERCGRWVQGHT